MAAGRLANAGNSGGIPQQALTPTMECGTLDDLYPDIDPGKGGYVDGPLAIYPEKDAASIGLEVMTFA